MQKSSTKYCVKHCVKRLMYQNQVGFIPDLQGWFCIQKSITGGDLQDGGGVGRGDHLPHHKYIRNKSTCGTTPTEHQLNAGRRPQTTPKARNSPCTWVGQKKKERNRKKRREEGRKKKWFFCPEFRAGSFKAQSLNQQHQCHLGTFRNVIN